MDLLERCILLLIGGGIGFILGFITRSQLRIEKELHEMHEDVAPKRPRDEDGFMSNRVVADILYLLVLVLVLFGVWRAETALNSAEKQAKEEEIARCEGGVPTRNAVRDVVDAVYLLGASFTVDNPDDPPLTEEEQADRADFLQTLEDFRVDTYAKIKPAPPCEPYVDDDDVKPKPIEIPID